MNVVELLTMIRFKKEKIQAENAKIEMQNLKNQTRFKR